MKQDDFLKKIANEGYNVGMGCNKSYATFDFLEKFPTLFTITALIISLLQIANDNFPYAKEINMTLLIISICSIYLEKYKKNDFFNSGMALTKIEKKIKDFYFELRENYDEKEIKNYEKRLEILLDEAQQNIKFSHIIFITDIIAHYKLFFQKKNNSEWFCNELGLKLFKDKVPENVKLLVLLMIILVVGISIVA